MEGCALGAGGWGGEGGIGIEAGLKAWDTAIRGGSTDIGSTMDHRQSPVVGTRIARLYNLYH